MIRRRIDGFTVSNTSNENLIDKPEKRRTRKKTTLNIRGEAFIKDNDENSEIIVFMPNVPIKAYLDDLCFILPLPPDGQNKTAAYCRLQDKDRFVAKQNDTQVKSTEESNIDFENFAQVRSIGHLRDKNEKEMIVCAPGPKAHFEVELNKLVIIATIPAEGKYSAPCYIRRKNEQYIPKKNKDIIDDGNDVLIDTVTENDKI